MALTKYIYFDILEPTIEHQNKLHFSITLTCLRNNFIFLIYPLSQSIASLTHFLTTFEMRHMLFFFFFLVL